MKKPETILKRIIKLNSETLWFLKKLEINIAQTKKTLVKIKKA